MAAQSYLNMMCNARGLSQLVSFPSENYIDGAEFLTLTESEVKAMVPPIGLARKVMRLLLQQEVTLASVLG